MEDGTRSPSQRPRRSVFGGQRRAIAIRNCNDEQKALRTHGGLVPGETGNGDGSECPGQNSSSNSSRRPEEEYEDERKRIVCLEEGQQMQQFKGQPARRSASLNESTGVTDPGRTLEAEHDNNQKSDSEVQDRMIDSALSYLHTANTMPNSESKVEASAIAVPQSNNTSLAGSDAHSRIDWSSFPLIPIEQVQFLNDEELSRTSQALTELFSSLATAFDPGDAALMGYVRKQQDAISRRSDELRASFRVLQLVRNSHTVVPISQLTYKENYEPKFDPYLEAERKRRNDEEEQRRQTEEKMEAALREEEQKRRETQRLELEQRQIKLENQRKKQNESMGNDQEKVVAQSEVEFGEFKHNGAGCDGGEEMRHDCDSKTEIQAERGISGKKQSSTIHVKSKVESRRRPARQFRQSAFDGKTFIVFSDGGSKQQRRRAQQEERARMLLRREARRKRRLQKEAESAEENKRKKAVERIQKREKTRALWERERLERIAHAENLAADLRQRREQREKQANFLLSARSAQKSARSSGLGQADQDGSALCEPAEFSEPVCRTPRELTADEEEEEDEEEQRLQEALEEEAAANETEAERLESQKLADSALVIADLNNDSAIECKSNINKIANAVAPDNDDHSSDDGKDRDYNIHSSDSNSDDKIKSDSASTNNSPKGVDQDHDDVNSESKKENSESVATDIVNCPIETSDSPFTMNKSPDTDARDACQKDKKERPASPSNNDDDSSVPREENKESDSISLAANDEVTPDRHRSDDSSELSSDDEQLDVPLLPGNGIFSPNLDSGSKSSPAAPPLSPPNATSSTPLSVVVGNLPEESKEAVLKSAQGSEGEGESSVLTQLQSDMSSIRQDLKMDLKSLQEFDVVDDSNSSSSDDSEIEEKGDPRERVHAEDEMKTAETSEGTQPTTESKTLLMSDSIAGKDSESLAAATEDSDATKNRKQQNQTGGDLSSRSSSSSSSSSSSDSCESEGFGTDFNSPGAVLAALAKVGHVVDYSDVFQSIGDIFTVMSDDNTRKPNRAQILEKAINHAIHLYAHCNRLLGTSACQFEELSRGSSQLKRNGGNIVQKWRDFAVNRLYRVSSRSRHEVYNIVKEACENLDTLGIDSSLVESKLAEAQGKTVAAHRANARRGKAAADPSYPLRKLPDDVGSLWNILWTWSKPKVNRNNLFTWQRVNHFLSARTLSRKDLLKTALQQYRGMNQTLNSEFELLPDTFILPKEYIQFVDAFSQRAEQRPDEPNYWIMKPVGLSRGRGISLVADIGDVCYGQSVIIQRYLSNPLLLDGYKFDLRIFVLVTSFTPLEAFVYDEGFVRVCTAPYSNDPMDLKNLFVHLTNSSIQKLGPNGAGSKATAESISRHSAGLDEAGGTKLSLTYLWRRLAAQNIDVSMVKRSINTLILKSLISCRGSMKHEPNNFELFGYDVFIDDMLRPWLIEVNSSPSMAQENLLDTKIKRKLVADTIRLIDPLPFDRAALLEVLQRRGAEMEQNRLRPFQQQQEEQEKEQDRLNRELTAILHGRKPRKVGEMPASMGQYKRLCPNEPEFDHVKRLLKNDRAERCLARKSVPLGATLSGRGLSRKRLVARKSTLQDIAQGLNIAL